MEADEQGHEHSDRFIVLQHLGKTECRKTKEIVDAIFELDILVKDYRQVRFGSIMVALLPELEGQVGMPGGAGLRHDGDKLRRGDLCRLPVLSLLLNHGRFSEFLDCTAFVGFLEAQQSPNDLYFGNGKLDIRGIPVLDPQLHDFSFLLGYTPILDDFKSTRCRKNDAF
jgi:hypothetical protein